MELTDIARLSARPDPLLDFKWRVKALPRPAFGVDETYIETVDLPWNNIGAANIFAGGGYNYFPQFHDISAFGINIYADCEGRSLKWLNAWRQSVKSFETGLYSLPKDYKENLVVQLMDTKNKPIVEVTLNGVWPADFTSLNLVSESGNRIVYAVQFSVDSQSIQFKM